MKNLEVGQKLYIKESFPGFEEYSPVGKECEFLNKNNGANFVRIGSHKVGVSDDEMEKYFSIEPVNEDDSELIDVDLDFNEKGEKSNVISIEEVKKEEKVKEDSKEVEETDSDNNQLTLEEIAKENDLSVEQVKMLQERAENPVGEELTLEDLEAIETQYRKDQLEKMFCLENPQVAFEQVCGLLPEKIISKQEDKITIVILQNGVKGIARLHEEDEWDTIEGIRVAWNKAKLRAMNKNIKKLEKHKNRYLKEISKSYE